MATPEIRYDQLGLHASRVGGVNRLMDLGMIVPRGGGLVTAGYCMRDGSARC